MKFESEKNKLIIVFEENDSISKVCYVRTQFWTMYNLIQMLEDVKNE